MAPPRSAFSYAVLRVVPDIEREEFVNAGLILFDRERRFLAARTTLDESALLALCPGADVEGIRAQLELVERLAAGDVDAAPFRSMSQSERFHWLTTPRSTVVQPGPLHAGTTDDPEATFEHLFRVLVLREASEGPEA
ncbi:MAG TPA: DUF3037 domain-containing protein [Candidatus Limnocylindria bacterium]|nr:DUF3037 domain-containing protein [Candidatus Limnocylindria bacterium]